MKHPTRSRWQPAIAVAALLASACSPASSSPDAGTPTKTTTASGSSTATDPAPASTAKAGWSVAGSWVSPSCGARTYARQLDLAIDESFRSADLLAPCPPQGACVGSGIVNRKGTFSFGRGTIELLVEDDGGSAGKGQPFPTSLRLDASTYAPVETDSNGKACPYTRARATP